MTARTEVAAPGTDGELPDASPTLEARDDFDRAVERFEANIDMSFGRLEASIDKAFERLEMKVAVGLEEFTNQFIRRVVVAGVAAILSIKALDLLFEQLLSR